MLMHIITMAMIPQQERSKICRTTFRRSACPYSSLTVPFTRICSFNTLQRNVVKFLANHRIPSHFQHGFSCFRPTWAGNFNGKVTREKTLESGALGVGGKYKNKATPRKLLETWRTGRLILKENFLTLAIDIGDHIILCCGNCPEYSRVLSSIPGLHPPDIMEPPPRCDYHKGAKLLPGEGQMSLIEDQCLRGRSCLNYSVQREDLTV